MKRKTRISIPGFDYDETRKENPWIRNFPVKIELNPDDTVAGFSQPITINAFRHMQDKFLRRLEKLFKNYKGSIKNETVEVTFGKEAILMLLSQANAEGITFTFGINDIPDSHGKVNERLTLMARAIGSGYQDKGEDAPTENKVQAKKTKASKAPAIAQAVNAPQSSGTSGDVIFEVVPRKTYDDVNG